MAAKRQHAPRAAPQVTVIGHNAQVLGAVGLFVGGQVPVRVYTASAAVEMHLAPYPGVTVTRMEEGYPSPPNDLPPPPYMVAVDEPEMAERIRAWLPRTVAIFLLVQEGRRKRFGPGWLRLHNRPDSLRDSVARRLETLRRVDRLMDLARGARHPLVMLFGDPDPDAIGAGLALAAIWRAAGASPLVRYTGEVQRYQNRLLLSWLRTPIERLRDEERAEADLIAVVDAQPGFWREPPSAARGSAGGALRGRAAPGVDAAPGIAGAGAGEAGAAAPGGRGRWEPPAAQVVIDHHPPREDTRAEFCDLRPDYGATSTILAEYLEAADLVPDRQLATALLYGITTDTDDLKRHTTSADIAAYDRLHGRIDAAFRARLEKAQIPPAVLGYLAWGIAHRVVYRDLMLVHFGEVPTADVLVQTADLTLLTHGIWWTVCAGVRRAEDGDRLVVVFRGDGYHQDVGLRARQAFAKLGSAGGHRTMGRAELPLEPGTRTEDTVELLIGNLFRRMGPGRRRRLAGILRGHLESGPPSDPGVHELVKD